MKKNFLASALLTSVLCSVLTWLIIAGQPQETAVQSQPHTPTKPTATAQKTAVPNTSTPVPTHTTQPTELPAPTVVDLLQITVHDAAYLRLGPSQKYPILAYLESGNQYPIIQSNESETWFQIEVDGQMGWVGSTVASPISIEITGTK